MIDACAKASFAKNTIMADASEMLDPFREPRRKDGVLRCPIQGDNIPMILRHADVRAAARDWQKFSSDAPFRVPIPSEEAVRTMRQLPIETNPPEHTEYREVVEPWFARAKSPEMIAKVESLIATKIQEATQREFIEIVGEFAVPVQSHALTYLLNVPESEAETFIGWGVHVFKTVGGSLRSRTGWRSTFQRSSIGLKRNPAMISSAVWPRRSFVGAS